jgi:hypothetical protein
MLAILLLGKKVGPVGCISRRDFDTWEACFTAVGFQPAALLTLRIAVFLAELIFVERLTSGKNPM